MAEECVSVQFEDGTSWEYCWQDATPYPGWDYENVRTGLRPSLAGGVRAWRSCQYFLKGMPAVCAFWKEGASGDEEGTTTSGSFFCSYVKDNTADNPLVEKPAVPTGFNNAQCDFLGRRGWCDKYTAAGDYDEDAWICTAPNPYLTGLGADSRLDGESALLKPVPRGRIWGYNDAEDGTGTGKCDCAGLGRGSEGCKVVGQFDGSITKEIADELNKLPIVCNFYRPFSLGFGNIEPSRKYKGDLEADGITITEQGWKNANEWESDVEYRLPLNYKLYNKRANYQKCQWWEEENGREFLTDGQGHLYLDGAPDIFDEAGRVEYCKCTNSAATPFNTRIFESATASGGIWEETGAQFALDGVWAKGGGPVCNGARPECPCYSGNWIYLTQERMYPGMAVTANQILELRFWESEWESQASYDEYYTEKPNFDDPEDPGIFTFTKWVPSEGDASDDALAGIDITKAKMVGKRLTLCQPAPLHRREFTKDYIESEDVTYWHAEIGTSTGDQRHFPSLIRNPDFSDIKPLTIVYPPYNDDPFGSNYCLRDTELLGYTKRSSNMEGDYIRTIGHTFVEKQIYTINTNVISDYGGFITEYDGVYLVKGENLDEEPGVIKNEMYNELREIVARGLKEEPDYINFTSSDDKFGYFFVPPVKLVYNQTNFLLICVDYGDGTWEYRWRRVISEWCGGVVKQTSYAHKYGSSDGGYDNPMPQTIGGYGSEFGTATAALVPLGGSLYASDSPEVISTFSLDDIWRGKTYYDYAYQIKVNETVEQEHWGAVGNTNAIMVAINDLNVNYIYDWEVSDVLLTYIGEDYTEREEAGLPVEVEMETVIADDNYIGPNYCVFKPKEDIRIRFLNSKWELTMTYGYIQPTNSPEPGAAIEWGGGKSDLHVLAESPHSFESGSGSLTVAGINDGSAQFLVHFKDKDGRNISAFATKLMVQIVREACRGVDIFYGYSALGKKYQLNPLTYMCINIEGDTATGDFVKHVEYPNCGDHEHSWTTWEGPMWFPFNVCRGYDLYDEWTYCNNCQAGYVGPKNEGLTGLAVGGGTVLTRHDYRYCGPYKWQAYGEFRGNFASSCNCGCSYWYSDASSVAPIFIGEGRRKTTVDLTEYAEYGWYPPPFGNDGRELMEKYISQDYVTHLIPMIVDGFKQRADWMPLVLDHSGFFATFHAYDENKEDYFIISPDQGFEPFRYVHQMTMNVLPAISEKITEEEGDSETPASATKRFRWEDLFEVQHEGNCSYPLPTYPISSNATKAIFYYLKPDWAAWAWQEAWKDIERNTSDELPETPSAEPPSEEDEERTTSVGTLQFLNLGKSPYITDYHKTEHRTIPDEGDYTIVYTAPVLAGQGEGEEGEEESEEEVGKIETYPTISILGGHPRAFEIIYDEDTYTSEYNIEFKDEGGQAATQGSSDEDNIYEETSGKDWIHPENILFDGTASRDIEAAKSAGREVVTGQSDTFFGFSSDYTYKYFNRGITADFTRDRLYYLPKEENASEDLWDEDLSTPEYEGDAGVNVASHMWKGSPNLVYSMAERTPEGSAAISKIVIKGVWGYVEGRSDSDPPKDVLYTIVKPGCNIKAEFTNTASGTTGPLNSSSTSTVSYENPPEGMEIKEYTLGFHFLTGPIEMLKKRVTKLILELSGDSSSFIGIESITITYVEYIDTAYENIKIWERKYIASEFSDVTGNGINLDGPGEHLKYNEDLLNMGQYFPFRDNRYTDDEVAAMDKTKIISCGIRYDEDEIISELDYNTLKKIEQTEQRDLYNYALDRDPSGDSLVYDGIVPYKFAPFLSGMPGNFPVTALVIESEKLKFEKHWRYKEFKQYDFWRPGGHKYQWDTENITRRKCKLFWNPLDYFEAIYMHIDHVGIGNPLELRPEHPIDAGNVLYSTRLYVQQAKYDRAMILSGGSPEYTDRYGIGGSSIVGTI